MLLKAEFDQEVGLKFASKLLIFMQNIKAIISLSSRNYFSFGKH